MNLNCPRPQWLQPLPCSALSLKAPSWPWSSHPVCWTPFPLWCMSPTGWALGHFCSAFFWVSTFNPCFHLSERREVKVKVSQSCPTATPWIIQSMDLSRPEYWNGYPFPSPGDLSNLGIKPRSPALHADSLPAEPPRKPKNTGVDSLSLLQRIFQTQELNRALQHFRQCYQGSPIPPYKVVTRASSLPGSLVKCSPGSHPEPLTWVCLQSYLFGYILTCVSVLVTLYLQLPEKL